MSVWDPSDLEKELQARFAAMAKKAWNMGGTSQPAPPRPHPRALPRDTWPNAESLCAYGPYRGRMFLQVPIPQLIAMVQEHWDTIARDPDYLRLVEEHIGQKIDPPPPQWNPQAPPNMDRRRRPYAESYLNFGTVQCEQLWLVPEDYLVGMLFGEARKPGSLPVSVKTIIEEHLGLRIETTPPGAGMPRPRAGVPSNGTNPLRAIVKTWYGQLSRKFHPDLGGSIEKQTVLNECRSALIKLMEAAGL